MVPVRYSVPFGTRGQKPQKRGTKWYPVPLGTGTGYHSAARAGNFRMAKDYDFHEDGRKSYELAMKILGERVKGGECLRRDGRCVICGRGECRAKKD